MGQLQSLLIPAFMGDSQSQNPLLLSEMYSPNGSFNLYLDKLGQIRSILGYTRQNSSAFTTDTGGSAAMIPGMYQYNKIAAGGITRQLLFILNDRVNEYELYYSTDLGVTKTLITDFGAGMAAINYIPDFATFGDEMYITNGVIAPQLWDGTTLSAAGGTQLAAPTLAAVSVGPLSGSYRYRVVPIKDAKVRKNGSVQSVAFETQNTGITVTWVADADTNVLGYEVYRTSGTGLDFYLTQYIDGRTTVTFDDYLPDADLITKAALSVIASHGDAPPTGSYFCVPHKGRMWWGRTDAFPRRWYWSDPGDADSVYTDRSYMDCTDSKTLGDISTGGTGDFEGMLVLWHRQSIWVVSGTGQVVGNYVDWNKRRTNARTGAVSHRATLRVPAGAVYIDQFGERQTTGRNTLAYLTPEKDIRIFDGDSDTIISHPIASTLQNDTKVDMVIGVGLDRSYAYVDAERSMYVWGIPSSSGAMGRHVAWNYKFGTWHTWSSTSFAHVIVAEDATAPVLLAAQALTATGAYIYKLWNGNTDNPSSALSTQIASQLVTKAIYPPLQQGQAPDLSHEKRFDSAIITLEKDATTLSSFIASIIPPDDEGPNYLTSSGVLGIDRTLTSILTTRNKVPWRQKQSDVNPGKYFHGTGCKIKIQASSSVGPWALRSIELLYALHEGTTR